MEKSEQPQRENKKESIEAKYNIGGYSAQANDTQAGNQKTDVD